MQLIFERGDRNAPVGHALIYFRGDDDSLLASYISVPPIAFDLSKFVPDFMKGMLQGMEGMGGMGVVATPMPPIPEEVPSLEYLHELAARRQDDLVFAGGTMRADPMRLAAETQEAAREYGELYEAASPAEVPLETPAREMETSPFADLDERERLNELTRLTGRMRDSLASGTPDEAIERQMRAMAASLPAKYRADRLVEAARTPGDRHQRMAELYLERSYKLYNEDYLDLERIDREIDALSA